MRDSLTTRAGRRVYVPNPTDQQRIELRTVLRSKIPQLATAYSGVVDEDKHIKNIAELANHVSETCESLLNGGSVTFGIAQKLLNSYLKYLWCDSRIPAPPHCPFDNTIIDTLTLRPGCQRQWTKANEPDYCNWVSAAKRLAGSESLSEWELRLFGDLI